MSSPYGLTLKFDGYADESTDCAMEDMQVVPALRHVSLG